MTRQEPAGWEAQLWLEEWREYVESMEEDEQDDGMAESIRQFPQTGETNAKIQRCSEVREQNPCGKGFDKARKSHHRRMGNNGIRQQRENG